MLEQDLVHDHVLDDLCIAVVVEAFALAFLLAEVVCNIIIDVKVLLGIRSFGFLGVAIIMGIIIFVDVLAVAPFVLDRGCGVLVLLVAAGVVYFVFTVDSAVLYCIRIFLDFGFFRRSRGLILKDGGSALGLKLALLAHDLGLLLLELELLPEALLVVLLY